MCTYNLPIQLIVVEYTVCLCLAYSISKTLCGTSNRFNLNALFVHSKESYLGTFLETTTILTEYTHYSEYYACQMHTQLSRTQTILCRKSNRMQSQTRAHKLKDALLHRCALSSSSPRIVSDRSIIAARIASRPAAAAALLALLAGASQTPRKMRAKGTEANARSHRSTNKSINKTTRRVRA